MRKWLKHRLRLAKRTTRKFWLAVRVMGLFRAIGFWCHGWGLFRQKRVFEAHAPQARYPVYVRPQSSDLDVFRQIFVLQEYSCLDDVDEVNLVIDCGANVG